MRTNPIAIVCLVVAAAAPAWSQVNEDKETTLLRKGAELLAQHKDADALAIFEKAFAIQKSPRALAQIGIAEGALGRWLAADEHLAAAIERKDDPWIAKHVAALTQARAVVGEHIGELVVEGNVAGASVLIDDRRMGTLPLPKPLRILAGSAVLAVRAAGYVTVTRPIKVKAGTRNREQVLLIKAPVAESPPPVVVKPPPPPAVVKPPNETVVVPPATVTPPKSRKGVWTGLGVAAGIVVAGGVTVGLLLGIPNNAPDLMTDLGTQPVRF